MNNGTPRILRRGILITACFALFPLIAGGLAAAQVETLPPENWWNPAGDAESERGKLIELVAGRKVYVNTSFTDSRTISEPSPTHTGDIRRVVLETLSFYKDLEVVPVPAQADFAIVVRATATTDTGDRLPNFSLALDSSTAVAVDVMVLVPGKKQSNGRNRPRVVWEFSSTNAQVEAQTAARSTVDGFLWELSKLKRKSAAKAN
jgi:hypothetical protein